MPAQVSGQPNDPQLSQSGRYRVFLQEGFSNPGVPLTYQGLCELQKVDQDMGKMEPVWTPNNSQRNNWLITDVIVRSPALITTGFLQHANRYLTDRWVSVRARGCLFNLQAITSNCARPDDPSQWDAKIIFGRTRLEKFGFPILNPLDGSKNVVVDINGDFSAQSMTVILPIAFQQVGAVIAVAEVVDAFFYDYVQCGDCGIPSDGCNFAYALQVANAGSPGLSSQLFYSSNGGLTWAGIDIPTLGGLSAGRMAPMGLFDIIVSQNQLGYTFAKFTDINNGVSNWTLITGGMVAGHAPLCITARDPNNAWIGAAGGYIYYLTQPGAAVTVVTDGSLTTQNIVDIHYYGRIIVAVGASNTVLYSQNNGQTFSLLTGPAVGQNLTAIWCISPLAWLVGTNNGQLWYTLNAGSSWTQIQLDPGITVIDDIQAYDENIIYLSVEKAGVAVIYRSTDGGNTWRTNGTGEIVNALQGAPVRMNVVAPCGPNTLLTVGRKTVGGTGYMSLARNQQ